jgi:hypothetical protein
MAELENETSAELPPPITPMLATARPLPASGTGYGWEWKYDGFRAIARLRADGQVRLDSRNGKDFTTTFPEVATTLTEALPGRRLSLDGELVATNPTTGAPDFAQLQQRLGTHPSAELLARVPVSYVVFDLLHLDNQPTTALPYTERRRLLAELGITHPRLLVPSHQVDVDPLTLLELARTHDIEGVVGKRLTSPYRPGRSPVWIKHAPREATASKSSSAAGYPAKATAPTNLAPSSSDNPPHPRPPSGESSSSARSEPAGPSPPLDSSYNTSPTCTPRPARSIVRCPASTPEPHAGSNPNSSATSNTAPSPPRATSATPAGKDSATTRRWTTYDGVAGMPRLATVNAVAVEQSCPIRLIRESGPMASPRLPRS